MSSDRTPCWPTCSPDGVQAGDVIGYDCAACGHNNVLHSVKGGGCIGCQLLHEADPAHRTAEQKRAAIRRGHRDG